MIYLYVYCNITSSEKVTDGGIACLNVIDSLDVIMEIEFSQILNLVNKIICILNWVYIYNVIIIIFFFLNRKERDCNFVRMWVKRWIWLSLYSICVVPVRCMHRSSIILGGVRIAWDIRKCLHILTTNIHILCDRCSMTLHPNFFP